LGTGVIQPVYLGQAFTSAVKSLEELLFLVMVSTTAFMLPIENTSVLFTFFWQGQMDNLPTIATKFLVTHLYLTWGIPLLLVTSLMTQI
jgi:hypothetical protein